MQENTRRIIRARNEYLAVGKRIASLTGPFRMWVALKQLMKREGLQPDDTTGGWVGRQAVTTVMSLDVVTMRYTTLAPMIKAREDHAAVVLGGKLFIKGGSNGAYLSSSVECLDLETGPRSEVAPMTTTRTNHGALGGNIYVTTYVTGGRPTLGTSVDAATN